MSSTHLPGNKLVSTEKPGWVVATAEGRGSVKAVSTTGKGGRGQAKALVPLQPPREGGSHGLSFHPEAAAAARSLPSWPHDYSLHQKTLPAGVCMLFGEGAFPAFPGLGSLNSRDVTRVGEKGSDVGRYGSCGFCIYLLCPCFPLAFRHPGSLDHRR